MTAAGGDPDGTPELTAPALSDLAFLVGEWAMTIANASFLPNPDATVTGRLSVSPIEGGALLAMRQHGDGEGPPLASWVIGRDGSRPEYTVLYTDARGVARVYGMTLGNGTWTLWRDDPEFSQRFRATVSPDGNRLDGRWEKRAAAGSWEHDFDVAYSRPPEGGGAPT